MKTVTELIIEAREKLGVYAIAQPAVKLAIEAIELLTARVSELERLMYPTGTEHTSDELPEKWDIKEIDWPGEE